MLPRARDGLPREKALSSQREKQREWEDEGFTGTLSCEFVDEEREEHAPEHTAVYRFVWKLEDDPISARAEITMSRKDCMKKIVSCRCLRIGLEERAHYGASGNSKIQSSMVTDASALAPPFLISWAETSEEYPPG